MDGESTSGVTSPDEHLRELKWKELISRVDAYRFYIKLILEINAFYYATTGAVSLISPYGGASQSSPRDYSETRFQPGLLCQAKHRRFES